MNIKEYDNLIRFISLKIEVHVWIFKKMIFLSHVLSLKSKQKYEYLRKWYFYKINSLTYRSICMHIKENDIFIEWSLFKIEVHLWELKYTIFLYNVFSLKLKSLYEYLRKLYFYHMFSLLNRSKCMNIKENDIFIR